MNLDDDPLAAFRRAQRRGWLWVLAVVLALLVLVALVPVPMGLGVFAWRLVRYDRVELVFPNPTDEPILVQINRSDPVPFDAYRVHTTPVRAGRVRLKMTALDGEVLDEREFFTDNQSVFYNTPGSGCFAVMDLAGWYRDPPASPPIRVVDRLEEDERLYFIPRGVFIRPRGTAPREVGQGSPVIWIEDVACLLLDESSEHLLAAQEMIIMQARWGRE